MAATMGYQNSPGHFEVCSWITRRSMFAPRELALIGGDRSFTYEQLAERTGDTSMVSNEELAPHHIADELIAQRSHHWSSGC